MTIKTARDVRSSLRGSAFRKVSFDGRTVDLRRIMTLGKRMGCRGPGQSYGETRAAAAYVRTSCHVSGANRQVEGRNR